MLTASLSVTSHGCTSAVPPAAAIASAVSLSLSALRATHATFAPAAASRSAIALPMPREAPGHDRRLAAQVNLYPPIHFVCHVGDSQSGIHHRDTESTEKNDKM